MSRVCILGTSTWSLGALIGVMTMSGQAPRQAPNAPLPSFEVASVKPHVPGPSGRTSAEAAKGSAGIGGRFVLEGISPLALLMRAFGIQPDQIGGPDWIRTQTFDIFANAPDGAKKEQYPLMFQSLLAERFKLQYHLETPPTQVYALLAAPGGSKVQPGLADSDAENYGPITTTQSGAGETRSASVRVRTQELGIYRLTVANGFSHYEYENVTIEAFANWIRYFLDRPVIDMTELKGSYQVTFDVPAGHCVAAQPTQADDQAVPAATDPCGASVMSSLKKQGLRLEKRRVPYEKLVVDHIEKTPTEN